MGRLAMSGRGCDQILLGETSELDPIADAGETIVGDIAIGGDWESGRYE